MARKFKYFCLFCNADIRYFVYILNYAESTWICKCIERRSILIPTLHILVCDSSIMYVSSMQWVRSLQREIHYQIMQMNLGDPGIPLVKHIFSSCVRVCAEYLLLQVICISIFHVYSRSLEFGTLHKWDDYCSSSPLKPIWSDSKQYYLSWLLAILS